MLRQYLHQLLPFKNCRHYADFIILEMLWWRFWKRQSGEFCIVCNRIPCYCIRYRNAAITEHGSLSRDNLFCSSCIVHPYRRNQPWFQAYTSVCPRGARREKRLQIALKLIIHQLARSQSVMTSPLWPCSLSDHLLAWSVGPTAGWSVPWPVH